MKKLILAIGISFALISASSFAITHYLLISDSNSSAPAQENQQTSNNGDAQNVGQDQPASDQPAASTSDSDQEQGYQDDNDSNDSYSNDDDNGDSD